MNAQTADDGFKPAIDVARSLPRDREIYIRQAVGNRTRYLRRLVYSVRFDDVLTVYREGDYEQRHDERFREVLPIGEIQIKIPKRRPLDSF